MAKIVYHDETIQDEVKSVDLSVALAKYNSDRDIRGVTPIYNTLFAHLRHKRIRILEVGYDLSILAWKSYFLHAEIHGLTETRTKINDRNLTSHICDPKNKTSVKTWIKTLESKYGKQRGYFDIIIYNCKQHEHIISASTNLGSIPELLSLRNLYSLVRAGGYYIIEGLNEKSQVLSHSLIVSSLCDNDTYFYAGTRNNVCVIFKEELRVAHLPVQV